MADVTPGTVSSTHRLLAIAAWTALLAAAAVCLWPLAANPGFWAHDDFGLRYAIDHGEPWFRWSWFADGSQLLYRPLGYAATITQLGIVGAAAPQVHWLSIGHHAINMALCAILFRRLGVPALAAMLLVLLPTCVEGVAWLADGYDRLALTFLLATAIAMTWRGPRALSCLPCFGLALVSKETSVSFAVVAVVLAWPRGRWVRLAAAIIVLGALCFALSRIGQPDPPAAYALRLDAEVPVRLLRYLAFPFALEAYGPGQVWADRWWPGLLGIGAVFALGLWRRPRAAGAGAAAAVAPLLPVSLLPQSAANYAYLATPGLAWVVWSAIGWRSPTPAASSVRGWRAATKAAVALLVLGPLVLHTRSVATHYFEAGRLLHNLDLAYRQVPPGMLEIDVACAPGLAESLVTRYVRYLEATDTRPRLRIVDPGAANAALVVFPDGSVLLR